MEQTSEIRTAEILTSQFILGVEEGARSASYYRDVLGFDIVQRPEGTGEGWYVVERGNFRIWLGEASGSFTPSRECQDHTWFAYAVVDDVDALYRELADRGAEFWHDIQTKPWGMREFAVTTVDGHRICFGQSIS